MDPQANDALDRQRAFNVMAGVFSALGTDTGADPSGWQLANPPGGMQVLNVQTGAAPVGQAGSVSGNIAGFRFNLPTILVMGVVAYLILKR